MTLHRFFLKGALPATGTDRGLPLSDRDRHHLARVLRSKAGDSIVVVDPSGREATVCLTVVTPEAVCGVVADVVGSAAAPRIILAQAVSRKERMELTVQKATELGVAEIWPVMTARCVVRLDEQRSGRRAERWRRIVEEAAKQSQRTVVPLVREPVSLDGLLEAIAGEDVVLVPWEEVASTAPGIGEALTSAGAGAEAGVVVVVGPEGGLEESEVEALRAAGAVAVSLGDTVLRTETAAIVAVAIAGYEMGALGGSGR